MTDVWCAGGNGTEAVPYKAYRRNTPHGCIMEKSSRFRELFCLLLLADHDLVEGDLDAMLVAHELQLPVQGPEGGIEVCLGGLDDEAQAPGVSRGALGLLRGHFPVGAYLL